MIGFFRTENRCRSEQEDRIKRAGWLKKGILAECLLLVSLALIALYREGEAASRESASSKVLLIEDDYIKWVDFTVSYEALCQAYEWDIRTHGTEHELDWVELLAYTAAKTGGDFGGDALKTMDKAAERLSEGESTMEELTEDLKYYAYYHEAYDAAIGGLVGEYREEDPEKAGAYVDRYGLKGYFPLARGFDYTHYDDFGAGRSYGYKRKHLGHDMMGQVGTPIIAVESGYVEALGWNQYGGWRIGIRSFDKKRYYYYAHLRQGFPYALDLEEGSEVQAGDVIGYMGHTGYSTKEDVNNIDQTHLHFGIQLIFDESQKEGASEIWIDCYQIVRFLYRNRSECARNDATKEWYRIYDMRE